MNHPTESLYAILSWQEICAKCKWAWIIFLFCIFYEISQFVGGPLPLVEEFNFELSKEEGLDWFWE